MNLIRISTFLARYFRGGEVSAGTVRTWIKRGWIEGAKVGSTFFVDEDAFVAKGCKYEPLDKKG